jgi:tetratricopeptide (TPR) repeat protein
VADVSLRLTTPQRTDDAPAPGLKPLVEALLDMMSPERVLHPRGWSLMSVCEPHAERLLQRLAGSQPRSDFVDHTAALSWVLIQLHLARGSTSAARELAVWAIMACTLPGEEGRLSIPIERPDVLRLMKLLPIAHTLDGKHDIAEQYQRNFVDWLDANRPADDTDRLVESDNFAEILRRRGRPEDLAEAKRIYERNLPIWRRRDPDSRDTLTAINNLALVEREMGHSSRAMGLFEEVLTRLRGREDMPVEALRTEVELAVTMRQTDASAAIERLSDALATAGRMGYQDSHPLALRILYQLGAAAHAAGDWPRACAVLRRAVPVFAATEGEQAAITTKIAWALFDAALRNGDADLAAEARSRHLAWLSRQADDALTEEQRGILADVERRTRR